MNVGGYIWKLEGEVDGVTRKGKGGEGEVCELT